MSRKGAGGGGEVEQQKRWEDPLVTQPGGNNEMKQTSRSIRGVCVRVAPRVLSKLSRALHAPRGKKLLQKLRNLENTIVKRAMIRFKGAWKDTIAFVGCLGVLQEDTMEGSL